MDSGLTYLREEWRTGIPIVQLRGACTRAASRLMASAGVLASPAGSAQQLPELVKCRPDEGCGGHRKNPAPPAVARHVPPHRRNLARGADAHDRSGDRVG